MLKKIFKTIAFLSLSMCLMLNNNVVHAGSGQSSAGGTQQGSGGSFGGGFGGSSGGGNSGVR